MMYAGLYRIAKDCAGLYRLTAEKVKVRWNWRHNLTYIAEAMAELHECKGIIDTCEKLMARFPANAEVTAWAQADLIAARERVENIEAWSRIMDG